MSCSPVIPATNDLNSNIKRESGFLKSLNLNQCNTSFGSSAKSVSLSGKISLGPLGMAGGGSISGSANESSSSNSTVGCGAVNILMQNHIDCVNNVSCMLNTNNTNVTINITPINSIIFTGDNITCAGAFNMDIKSLTKVNCVAHINATMAGTLTAAVQTSVQNFTKQLAAINKGTPEYGPNGQGTQAINIINYIFLTTKIQQQCI